MEPDNSNQWIPSETLSKKSSEENVQTIQIPDGDELLHSHEEFQVENVQSIELGLCRVCSDQATGYHYSVATCEGCKGFFKRTVQKQLKYTCKGAGGNCEGAGGNCEVTKLSRNNCQFCRYQKCLNVGMKTEAVRDDRTPGGRPKLKRLKADHAESVEKQEEPPEVVSPLIDGKDWRESIQILTDAQPQLIPNSEGILATDPDFSVNDLLQYGFEELSMIIQWAKKIPGFADLSLDDRISLLKASFMDIIVIRLSYRSMDRTDGRIQFTSSVVLNVDEAMRLGWSEDLLSSHVAFIKRLKTMNLDLTQFCVMNALVLCYPDAPDLGDKQTLSMMQSFFLECLRQYLLDAYPDGLKRYGKFLLQLPTLRNISGLAMENFFSLRLEGKVNLTELVAEMLDISVA